MASSLREKKQTPQSKSPTSSTPTHDPPGPIVSGTHPGCVGQKQTNESVVAGDQPRDVPTPLVTTDEDKEIGIPDPRTPAISGPSLDCAGQEQGKEDPTRVHDQLQHAFPPLGTTDKDEGMGINIVRRSGQTPAISSLCSGNAKQEQNEICETSGQLQHMPSGSAERNEEVIITAIRVTHVALGLGRPPAGFYVVLHYNGLQWRTENKPSSVNKDVVEWTSPIAISSDLSAVIRLEVYASFEYLPTLGTGEQLRRLTVTVGQLLSCSKKNTLFVFAPKGGDVVSPCSSILVTIKQHGPENSDPLGSRVVGAHWSAREPRGELEEATDQGHNALARYRHLAEKQDLERSIQRFQQALNVCPRHDPRRAVAKSNLAMAKLILSRLEGTDAPLQAALRLYREVLAARPADHPDRPLTLIQLALVHLARLQRGRNSVDEANGEDAEGLLHEAIELSTTESYEKRAATVLLWACFVQKGGRLPTGGQSSTEQDSSPHLADENAWNLGVWLGKRFERFGDLADLQQAITILEGLVRTTPVWDGKYCEALGSLATALLHRFERLGRLGDLEDAISRMREAVRLIPSGHPDRPGCLSNLGAFFETRFMRLGQLSDLEDAISALKEAVRLIPNGHLHKPMYLNNLGNSFQTRFEHLGQLSDLEDGISTQREVVRLTPNSHPNKHLYLNNLGLSFQTRFDHLGQLSDLEDTISTLREAVRLTPNGHPRKPIHLSNLGNSFDTRFERFGQLSDLEDAISTQKEAVRLTPDGHPDKPRCLNNLGVSFQNRFSHLGQLSDLQDAYSAQMEATRLTPNGHPDMPMYLDNLGLSLLWRFSRLGQLGDLEDAISRKREALRFTPDGHPDKPMRLDNLGSSLQTRFLHLGQLSDLEDAISSQKEAVRLTSDGHPEQARHFSNLGNSFKIRFLRLGQLDDLEDAISAQRRAVHLTPDDHLKKPLSLNNLGTSLYTRFNRFGQPGDLEDAISTQKEAVRLNPNGHPNQPMYLNNLGHSFQTRFEHHGQLSDLEDAISTLREAVRLTPHDHPHKSGYLNNLASLFIARFLRLRQLIDLKHAVSLSSHVASMPIGVPHVRLSAAQRWIQCARLLRDPSLLHAYSVAVGLTPQLAWVGLSLSHRFDELIQGADVVREAAAAALDANFPETALEWLEQGRSVIWGDLFQLRSSYDELSSAHPDYASRLRALSTQLDQASAAHERSLSTLSEQSRNTVDHAPESLRQVADKHRALAIERDKLLQEIRRLPGFERFLLRKPFSQLRAAAHSGPVVVLNAAKSRCDALIVVAGLDHVIHVPLPNFTSERCANIQVILNRFVRDTREGKKATSKGVSWDDILPPLWQCIVKPVLDALAFSNPKELSRIFWCPTGPLAFLPIHAAGFYDRQHSTLGHKIFDFVVSSYVPTLSILVRSPSPAAVPNGDLRLLAVRQPSSDGQTPLPGVAVELARIKDVVESSPSAQTILVESSLGTVEEVLELMKESDWVHFACHGVQDGVDSGLCLADRRRLTLRDIVAVSRPRGGLAFLSACQTAKGDKKLSDEAIHIAAGMLFAGYGGVIGTMWSISDGVAPRVARDVYLELLGKGGRPDYRGAARALQETIGRLRNQEVPISEWIPFIHVGL